MIEILDLQSQIMELKAGSFEEGCQINGGWIQLVRLATIEAGQIKAVLGQLRPLQTKKLRAGLRQIFFG